MTLNKESLDFGLLVEKTLQLKDVVWLGKSDEDFFFLNQRKSFEDQFIVETTVGGSPCFTLCPAVLDPSLTVVVHLKISQPLTINGKPVLFRTIEHN